MFLHVNVVILTARDAGRLQAISGQKKSQRYHVFSRQKPLDDTCIQGAGPYE